MTDFEFRANLTKADIEKCRSSEGYPDTSLYDALDPSRANAASRKRAERQRRKDAGEVRVECWIDTGVRDRLIAGCSRSGVGVSRGIEMMINDAWPVKT